MKTFRRTGLFTITAKTNDYTRLLEWQYHLINCSIHSTLLSGPIYGIPRNRGTTDYGLADVRDLAQNPNVKQEVRDAMKEFCVATANVIGTDVHKSKLRHTNVEYKVFFGPQLTLTTVNVADLRHPLAFLQMCSPQGSSLQPIGGAHVHSGDAGQGARETTKRSLLALMCVRAGAAHSSLYDDYGCAEPRRSSNDF